MSKNLLRHVGPSISILLALSTPAAWGQKSRLDQWIAPMERVQLQGSVNPLAQAQYDQGPADPALKFDLITMGLAKTPEQQADLDAVLGDLQDLSSPNYHRWLTPEQYADRFGLSQPDIDKLTSWLQGQGIQVALVSRGRDYIVFSATASQIETAFHAQIHRYAINGETHFANATPIEIPKVLDGIVAGFRGLNDFKPRFKPRRNVRPLATLAHAERKPKAIIDSSGINYLVPDDLAVIYGIKSVYSHGWFGDGQSIAIAGGSDIDMADIEAFRSIFNLPFNDPQVILAPGSPDPGVTGGIGEADLDIEWSGAIARNAQIIYVNSVDPFYSAFAAIDNAYAPVLNTSFGFCEWHFTLGDVQLSRGASQKAAALGISWVSSSGDSGAAGCENHNGPFTFATTRMSVLIPSTLPEVTAVGGTEFNEGNGTYWSATQGTNGVTALGYIPEAAWNDETQVLTNLGQSPFLQTVGDGFAAGGGGASIWFTKPTWQTGTGVPNDNSRDVPDVAFTASWDHDPYFLTTQGGYEPNGGTSAAAPVFAGILALVNQYVVGQNIQSSAGLGNVNPMLYFLAQHFTGVFHDITIGNNQVPCVPGSTQDCGNSSLFGYSAGTGYDLATGWGSLNADVLIGTWASVLTNSPHVLVKQFTATPLTVTRGNQISLSVTIQNVGQADAGAFLLAQYLSANGQFDSDSIKFAQCSYTGLSAGVTSTCSGAVTIPASIAAGKYYLISVADPDQKLNEPNRSGSVRQCDSGQITVR